MKANDLIGQKFGMLTVVSRAANNKYGKAMWNCVCECGRKPKKPISTDRLKSGNSKSCGCYRFGNKFSVTHGEKKTRLWREWSGMKNRCSKNFKFHKNYYDRGISVCEEWKSYIAFRNWALSNGYDDGLTLDRINNDKGYSPDNCRWATMKQQSNNRRTNKYITANSETRTMKEWAEYSGIKYHTIQERIARGWKEEDAVTIKPSYQNSYMRRKNK